MCTLPAGLNDDNVEIFRHENNVFGLYKGHKTKYYELPVHIRSIFNLELNLDIKALAALSEMGYYSDDAEEMFVGCRYGNFDNSPDLDLKTGKLTPDSPSCDKECTCPGFGKVCLVPCGLSKKEYSTVRLMATGLQDDEISNVMGLSVSTIRTHLSKVREKLNLNNRAEITNWAIKRNII